MEKTKTSTYLQALPADQRVALEDLRTRILAAAPDAEEHFGYGLPGFKHNGHPLIYMGAAKEHVALYGSVPAGFEERLKDFDVSKGSIRFTPEKPLPAALVKDIVKAKVAEIEVRWPIKVKKLSEVQGGSGMKKAAAKTAVPKSEGSGKAGNTRIKE